MPTESNINIKKFKTITTDNDQSTTMIYNLGAKSENVDYAKTGNENITNVKLALDDLYSKVNQSGGSGGSSSFNKADIGFTQQCPITQTAPIQKDTKSDFCYKDITYSFLKVRITSTTGRTINMGTLLSDDRIESITYLVDGIQSSYQIPANFISSNTVLNPGTKIQFKIVLKPNLNIAIYNDDPSIQSSYPNVFGWAVPTNTTSNSIVLLSNTFEIPATNLLPVYINCTFSCKIDRTTRKNITRIGTVITDWPTDILDQNRTKLDRNLTNNSLLDLIYPVGSIYLSANGTPPNYLFGGTWQEIKGRFLLSQGVYNTNQFVPYVAGRELGREDSVLIKHKHEISIPNVDSAKTNDKTKLYFSFPSGVPSVSGTAGKYSWKKTADGKHNHLMTPNWKKNESGKQSAVRFEILSGTKYTRENHDTGDSTHSHTLYVPKNSIRTIVREDLHINDVTKTELYKKSENVISNDGLGENFSNIPPSLVIYMWKRIG